MALVQATIETTIKTEMENTFGTPEDAAEMDKFAESLAKIFIEILKNQMVVTTTVVGGSSSGVYVDAVT